MASVQIVLPSNEEVGNNNNGETNNVPLPISGYQSRDTGNTKIITSAEAQPANPWVGEWTPTQSKGIVAVLTILASTDQTEDGLGGTFTFEFSDDGVSHNGISEPRVIMDFQSIRDFPLKNVGNYYRIKFEPDRALESDSVFITTTMSSAYDGPFVRLGDQQIEKANAAMPQTFAYIKGFKADGRSADIGVSDDREIFTTTSESEQNKTVVLGRTSISATAYEILVDLSDTTNFPHAFTGRIDISALKAVIDVGSNSVGAMRIGVITRIDGTNADISYLFNIPFGKSNSRILSIHNFSPSQMKFGVSGGSLVHAITNRKDTNNASVNTTVTLNSPRGATTVVPAVGDVIVKYLHTSGNAWDTLIEGFYHSDANA